jgi:outer membrane protein assembly factor BamB
MIPAVHGGRVYVGSEQGYLFALDLATGAEVWSRQSDGIFGHTQPVVVDGRVVLGDRGSLRPTGDLQDLDRAARERFEIERRGGAVLALDADDGTLLWKTVFGATGLSTPGVGPGFLVAGYGSVVARIDLETGAIDGERLVRTGRNAFGSPTVVGDELVFGNLDGHLYVHDLATGARRWAFRVPDGQVHEFVHTGERIYASTTHGLYALGDDPERSAQPAGFVLEAP